MKWIVQYFDSDCGEWIDCEEIYPCDSKNEALAEARDWRSKQCAKIKTRVITF